MKKVAIVSLESTQIKLTLATILDNESFVVNEVYTEGTKIAADLASDSLIKTTRINECLLSLKSFKAIIASSDVNETIAFASYEFLDAKNQKSFFEELYSQTGFRFSLLSKDEQLMNSYTAVINSLDVPRGVIVNISGTKTQILCYNRRNLLSQHNFDFGTCTLAEEFVKEGVKPEDSIKQMYDYVYKHIKKLDMFKELEADVSIVGLGDAYLSLGKLARRLKKNPYDRDHGFVLSKNGVDEVYDFVKTLDLDKTKKLKGISSDRADYLASGLAIIKAIQDFSNIETTTVCGTNVTEGMLFNKACPLTAEKPLTDILGYSLNAQNAYYNNYSKNTAHVYELSLMLFKQLKVLHKLSRTYVKVLRVASTFHDAGKRISANNYTKSGFGIVLNANIYGVSYREQVLASFVVASQKLEDFSMTDWVRYKDIVTEEDVEAVRKLAVIVRLADALDKFGRNYIVDISCDILGDSVIMKTITTSPADMEIREGIKLENDFIKAFKKHLEIL